MGGFWSWTGEGENKARRRLNELPERKALLEGKIRDSAVAKAGQFMTRYVPTPEPVAGRHDMVKERMIFESGSALQLKLLQVQSG